MTIEFRLVGIDLPLLVGLSIILPLELITNERPGAQPKSATDGRTGSRTTDGSTDKAARGRAAERANSGAFFPRG